MYLTHALRAILRTAVATGDALWKYVSLLLSGTPPTQTFIADASVNANVLTLNGDVRPSNLNPYVEGYYSNYFDGSGDYLQIPDNAAFVVGTGNFTIEAWIYPTQVAASEAPIFKLHSDGSIIELRQNTNKLDCHLAEIGSSVTISSGTIAMAVSTWTHVAFVRTGTTTYTFINGVLDQTKTSQTQNLTTTVTTKRIAANQTAAYLFTGYISNFRFIKGTAVYTANFTPPTAPLTAISGTSLLTCQSNRLIDNSANNFALTKNGDVAVRGFAPFTPPTTVNVDTLYSTYFDGNGDYLTVPNNAAFAFGSGNFTVEMWVSLSSASGTVVNYSNGQSSSSNFAWELYQLSSSTVMFSVFEGATQYISSSAAFALNQWNHIACVRNGNTLTTYVNGVAGGTTVNVAGVTISAPVGATLKVASYGNGSAYVAGLISNFRIVKGTAVYTANFTPPTSPLTAISGTSLLTCQSATIIDNSTNALTITSYGQAQPDAISPFTQVTTPVTATYLGSGYFDGTGDTINLPTSTALLGAGNYTVEFWVNLPAAPTGGAYFTVFAWGSSGSVLRCFLLNETVTKLGVWIGATNVVLYSTSAMVGQWAHIALVRSGTTLTAYINGVSVATASDATNYNTGQLYIASQAATNFLTGYISNFRIVVGTAVYTANFAPPATPLTVVANTALLTLQTDQPAANKQFVDNSGSNLVITQAGNATQGSFSPYGANWSNYFDGTGDYLTVPSNAAFQLGTGDFTFECWFNPTSLASAAINTLFNIGTYSTGLFIRCASIIEIYINNVQRLALSSTGILSTNTWQHVALVRSGSTCKVYVNGVSVATFTDASSISPTTATVTLGMSAHSATETLTGYMSNVRLVKGTAVYTAAFTPPTAPLTPIAGTSLLTCQSRSLVDNSINGFAITRNGDVSVQRFSPFSPVIQAPVSYSTYFDGSGDYITTASNGSCAFGSGDFTIEFWLYANSVGATDQGLIDMRPTSTNGYYPYLYMYSGQITYWLNATAVISSASGAITAGSWYHVALTRSGSSNKLFINGIQSGSTFTSTTALLCDNARPVFGSAGTSLGGSPLNGYISNARIVKGTAVYTAAFTPPTAPLTAIANTSLLTCQSPTIVDNSSNALALTGFGNVIQKPFHPFGTTSYSQYFDGNGDYLTSPTGNATLNTALDILGGNYTVEFWMYKIADTNATIITNFTSSGANGWQINARENGGIEVVHWVNNSSSSKASTFGNYSINTWVHVAVVKLSGNYYFYINGTEVGIFQGGTRAAPANGGAGTGLGIATYIQNLAYPAPLTGNLSNLRVVKGTAVYTANFTPPTAPLAVVSGTSLLTCQNLTAIDNSSNAFTITKNGNVSGSLSNPFPANAYTTTTTGTAYTPALYGGSAYFDGTGDYLTAAANTSFTYGTGNFTIEGWHYLTAASSVTKYLFDQRVSGQGYLPALYVDAGKYVVYINTAIPLNVGTVVSNAWVHWALVKNGSTTTLYINGVSVGSFSDTNNYSATAQFRVGSEFGALGSYDWQGYMSDLRITKGQALYTGGFVPPIAPLQAVKNTVLLLNMDKSGITDSSRCVDLETVGDAKIRYESPYSGSYYSNYFDGSGDYLSIASSTAFGFGTGDFTIEFWAYSTSTARQDWVDISDGTNRVLFYYSGSAVTFYGNGVTAITGSALTTNTWVHYALVKSSGSTKLYVNGTQAGSTYATNQNYGTTAAVSIGKDMFGSTYITGNLSNFRIVKGTAVYTANFTPSTTPLTAITNTSLLTCQSKSFVDNSSNNFTLTRNGDVAVRSYNPFQANIANSSMYFDGTGDYISATGSALGAGAFTIEMWVYMTSYPNGQNALYSNGTSDSTSSIAAVVYINSSGTLAIYNYPNSITTSTTVPLNQWNHIAVIRNSGTINLYINGVNSGSGSNSNNITDTAVQVMRGFGGILNSPIGYVADLRVTRGAARYTANFTPPTAPLPTS